MTPLVSVCIPCYNNAAFVGEAIESALSQTHPRVEVVVVDDGSTDNSVEVLKSFGDRITFEAGPNRGACAARNRAFELSQGDYIQFLDADDRLLPNKIERQIPYLERDEADLVFCRGYLFGDEKGMRVKREKIRSPEGMDPFLYCLVQGLSTEGPLHRRRAVENSGGFRVGLKRAQEYDFHVRLSALRGELINESGTPLRIMFLDEALCEHRNHDGPRITRSPRAVDVMVKLYLALTEQLEQEDRFVFDQARRRAVAGCLFQYSIYAFRDGAPESARLGFERAYQISSQFEYSERPLYKLLASRLGPMRVEYALLLIRRLRDAALARRSK